MVNYGGKLKIYEKISQRKIGDLKLNRSTDLPRTSSLSSNEPKSIFSKKFIESSECEKNFYHNKRIILFKTEMCRSFIELGHCKYGDRCQFCHSYQELRDVKRHPKYKTEICKTFWNEGSCPYGGRCCFVHLENLENTHDQSDSKIITEPDGRGNKLKNKIETKEENCNIAFTNETRLNEDFDVIINPIYDTSQSNKPEYTCKDLDENKLICHLMAKPSEKSPRETYLSKASSNLEENSIESKLLCHLMAKPSEKSPRETHLSKASSNLEENSIENKLLCKLMAKPSEKSPRDTHLSKASSNLEENSNENKFICHLMAKPSETSPRDTNSSKASCNLEFKSFWNDQYLNDQRLNEDVILNQIHEGIFNDKKVKDVAYLNADTNTIEENKYYKMLRKIECEKDKKAIVKNFSKNLQKNCKPEEFSIENLLINEFKTARALEIPHLNTYAAKFQTRNLDELKVASNNAFNSRNIVSFWTPEPIFFFYFNN